MALLLYFVLFIVLSYIVGFLHIWHYIRTRSRYHLVLVCAAALISIQYKISVATHSAKSVTALAYAATTVEAIADGLLYVTPAVLLACWGQTVRKAQQVAGRLGPLTWLVGSVGTLLLAAASLLALTRAILAILYGWPVSWGRDSDTPAQVMRRTAQIAVLVCTSMLALYCAVLALLLARGRQQRRRVVAERRNQAIALAASFLMLAIATIGAASFVPTLRLIATVLAFIVLLYPCYTPYCNKLPSLEAAGWIPA